MQKQNRVNKDNPADPVLPVLSQRHKSKAVHIRGYSQPWTVLYDKVE